MTPISDSARIRKLTAPNPLVYTIALHMPKSVKYFLSRTHYNSNMYFWQYQVVYICNFPIWNISIVTVWKSLKDKFEDGNIIKVHRLSCENSVSYSILGNLFVVLYTCLAALS